MPALFAADSSGPLILRSPSLSKTQIVFVFAGDLWIVPREGGEAKRLTTGPGVESNPQFSPDGTQIAFTGEYDGNVDVFVVPAGGGVPKRLTWHPSADNVLGWTPDGKKILFTSNRTSFSRFAKLFTVSLDGGLEEELPLPMGFEAAYSSDGAQLAYVPIGRAFYAWKRYRGGMTTPIWIANMSNSHVEKVPRTNSNDYSPMWADGKLWFLSDRNGPVTLFSYDPKTKKAAQAIPNTGLDLKSASAGPGAIVYEQFGSIHLYDLKSGKTKPVPITVAGDLPELRERFVRVGSRLTNAHLSPSAARALFETRGEIFTVPAEKGDARNITNTSAAMERDPAWSPDGKSIAYFSDESGEYMLHIGNQNGTGDPVKIALGEKPGFYFSPRWSPDSKKIAYMDSHQTLWYIDVNDKKPVKVDKDPFYGIGVIAPSWSPDSKWLAYARRLQNYMDAIFVYSLADGKPTQLTDGMSDARHPVFDKEGKYLFFTASTDDGASLQPDIHSFSRPSSRSIYLATLDKTLPSPLAPESDEEKPAEEKKPEEAKKAEAPKADAAKPELAKPEAPKKDVSVKIDFDSILQRILALPMPPRRYTDLQAGKAGVLFAIESPAFGPGLPPGQGSTVHRYDLKARKSDVAISGVGFFEIAQNGEKMLYRQGDRWYIAPVRPMATGGAASGGPSAPPSGGMPSAGGPTPLNTDSLELRISPREEWKQMYREVWRLERDFFYDPNFHGLDLKAAEKKYEPYLAKIASRGDLNYLFAEMLGEMTVGHLSVGGGEQPEVKRVQTGLLGCDYKIENGRYRFARVYNGENWNPDLRAPLTQPGVNVVAGEYLLAVNGRELRATDNVYSLFEATAGKSVLLRVGPNPDGSGAREVTVVPVPSEAQLRHLAWIEDNRRKVDQMTGGRVAYVYMPDTSFGGYTNFNRYFYAQVGKEAAIIDERFNGGGALATDIIEMLKRKLLSMVATRDGELEQQPQGAIFGPKVMLINEFAGSGGDAMPWYFKRAGVGKLIGKRTWGGLVGRAFAPQLMDGGFVTSPSSGVFNPMSGQWEVENIGIAPDIEVELDPEIARQGKDPQLEKAVEVVMAELAKSPLPIAQATAVPELPQAVGSLMKMGTFQFSTPTSRIPTGRLGGRDVP
jgi:tricorn protease